MKTTSNENPVPQQLVIRGNQTDLSINLVSNWTMDLQGSKQPDHSIDGVRMRRNNAIIAIVVPA